LRRAGFDNWPPRRQAARAPRGFPLFSLFFHKIISGRPCHLPQKSWTADFSAAAVTAAPLAVFAVPFRKNSEKREGCNHRGRGYQRHLHKRHDIMKYAITQYYNDRIRATVAASGIRLDPADFPQLTSEDIRACPALPASEPRVMSIPASRAADAMVKRRG